MISKILVQSLLKSRTKCFTQQSNTFAKNVQAAGGLTSLGKKKKLGKVGPIMEKKILPVEEDPHKLVSFVCGSNIYKEGKDVEIKPDNEYPQWLWSIHTGKPPKLEELSPDTIKYWKKVRKMRLKEKNALASLRRF